MPPRDPELPEGTDHIINGAAGASDNDPGFTGTTGSSGTGATGATGASAQSGSQTETGTSVSRSTASSTGSGTDSGFVAKGDDKGGATDKLVSQVRDQVSTLRGQATDKLRGLADDGKGRATGLLDNFGEVIKDAARSIDERLGEDYGRYAHQAADAVTSFSGRVREKTIEDLLDEGRSAVKASPGVAIAAAAIAGFALMRVVRTGLDEFGGSERSGRGRKRGNADTTAAGGV